MGSLFPRQKPSTAFVRSPSWIERAPGVQSAVADTWYYLDLREIYCDRVKAKLLKYGTIGRNMGLGVSGGEPHFEWPPNDLGLEGMDSIVDFLDKRNQGTGHKRNTSNTAFYKVFLEPKPSFALCLENGSLHPASQPRILHQPPSELARSNPVYEWFHTMQEHARIVVWSLSSQGPTAITLQIEVGNVSVFGHRHMG